MTTASAPKIHWFWLPTLIASLAAAGGAAVVVALSVQWAPPLNASLGFIHGMAMRLTLPYALGSAALSWCVLLLVARRHRSIGTALVALCIVVVAATVAAASVAIVRGEDLNRHAAGLYAWRDQVETRLNALKANLRAAETSNAIDASFVPLSATDVEDELKRIDDLIDAGRAFNSAVDAEFRDARRSVDEMNLPSVLRQTALSDLNAMSSAMEPREVPDQFFASMSRRREVFLFLRDHRWSAQGGAIVFHNAQDREEFERLRGELNRGR